MYKGIVAEEFAQALMLEQVRFTRHQLLHSEDTLVIKNIIHQIYQLADHIHLKEIIQLEQLHAVVQKYAFELNLGPEILEFIGFVSQKIHQYSLSSDVTLAQLRTDDFVETWLNKILEINSIRAYIAEYILHNEKVHAVSLQLANQILENNTPWLDNFRKKNIKAHKLSDRFLRFIQEQQHSLELKLEHQLADRIRQQLAHIILLPQEELSEIIFMLWNDLKNLSLKELYGNFESIDFEDFFILGYENWRDLRKTHYIQGIVLSVVSAFYEYFADYNMQELLEAVGLDEHDLNEECERFLPHAAKALDDIGILDNIIKIVLMPFYDSGETHRFIENYLNSSTQ